MIGVRVLIERRVIARRWMDLRGICLWGKFRKRGRSRSVTLAAFPRHWFVQWTLRVKAARQAKAKYRVSEM